MSASYWDSSQRHKWKYTRESLAKEKQKLWSLECQLFPQGLNVTIHDSKANKQVTTNIPVTQRDSHYDRDYNLRIYCYFLIMKLGRRLNIRQCALVTAHVYLSRFLLRASVREVNSYLLITTCIYLACKVEECPQHIRTLVNEARSLWPEFIPPDVTKVTEFEFYLIEELQSYLIVHHPYRSLEQIEKALSSEKYNYKLSDDELQKIWSLINDSYTTDVHLLYSPHVIAISCLFAVSCIIHKPEDSTKRANINMFIAETQVNLEQVMFILQELISLYDHWDKYNESRIRALLHELYLRQQTPAIQ